MAASIFITIKYTLNTNESFTKYLNSCKTPVLSQFTALSQENENYKLVCNLRSPMITFNCKSFHQMIFWNEHSAPISVIEEQKHY